MSQSRILFDFPHYVPERVYTRELDQCVDRLTRIQGVKSVYQIGGISTPGISDLDVVVITDNEVAIDHDPRAEMSAQQLYLFAHALYAVPQKLFERSQAYTAFHNYRLLHGPDVIEQAESNTPCSEIKVQTALEFLVRMFIVTELESAIGVSKIRSLLLHVNGLNYDFEFLGISNGPLFEHVQEMIRWRRNWFNEQPTDAAIIQWLSDFRIELGRSLEVILHEHILRLPTSADLQYSRSIRMRKANHLTFRMTSSFVPRMFRFTPRFYVKLANRLCRFDAQVPFNNDMTKVLVERNAFLRDLRDYNKEFLPAFYPMGTSLGLI